MSDPAAALSDAVELAERDDRRRALRALLRRPLLPAGDPAFALVRRHARQLQEWLLAETGWVLTVDAEAARLRKQPTLPVDPTRPATSARSQRPFARRQYVLLCLALAALERADAQITLGRLADRVLEGAADPALVTAGLTFRMATREERGDLVTVVRLLLELGALERVAGDEDAYVAETGDVLYDVRRRVLAGLLAAPRGASTVPAAAFPERLAALAAQPLPDTAAARTRAARQRLTRRLLDDPVVYVDDLDDDERDYLQTQRAAVLRRVAEATGLEAEVRAEGVALLDPTGEATDLGMPEEGTEGHVTLLLAERLAAADAPVPLDDLAAVTGELVTIHGHHWSKAAREPGAEHRLAAQAVAKLAGLGLVRVTQDGVEARPALARFRVGDPRLLGGAS